MGHVNIMITQRYLLGIKDKDIVGSRHPDQPFDEPVEIESCTSRVVPPGGGAALFWWMSIKIPPLLYGEKNEGVESICFGIQIFEKLGKTWRGILIVEGNLSGNALLIVRDSGKFTGVMENSHTTIQIHRFHKIGQFLYKLIS